MKIPIPTQAPTPSAGKNVVALRVGDWQPVPVSSQVWNREIAEAYDATSAPMFEPAVLGPTVALLCELARGGPALEFAIGTGRVALPLVAQGIAVSGIELSPYMADQLRAKPGGRELPVTIGDMTTTRVAGAFKLVYVVWNAIMNVTTQDEQVAVFTNAAIGRMTCVRAPPDAPLSTQVPGEQPDDKCGIGHGGNDLPEAGL